MGIIRHRRYPFTLQPLPVAGLTAHAGDDQALGAGVTTATLRASAEGGQGPYTYAWTRVSGGSVVFGSSSSATTTVTLTVGATLRVTVYDVVRTIATDDVFVDTTAVVGSVTPDSGTELGTTSVVLDGVGFTDATAVAFGGVAASSFVVDSDIQITATVPAYTAALSSTAADNAVVVTVTKPGGVLTLTGGYTYTSELARLGATSEGRVSDPRITVAGGLISNVPCFNGNGAGFVQATSGQQPAYGAASFHGGPGALFDGVDDFLRNTMTTAIAIGKRPSIFIVFSRVGGSSTRAIGEISAVANTSNLLARMTTAHWNYTRRDSSGFSVGDSVAGVDTGTKHLIEMHMDATGALGGVIDGTARALGITGTVVTDAINRFAIGGDQNGLSPGNIYAVHWAVFADGAAGATLTAVRSFLNGAHFPGYTGNSYA